MKINLILLLAILSSSCMMQQKDVREEIPLSEKYRPQFHFSPLANWMNDPNGMFYLDGEYHLFYQHNPEKPVWGPMYWGHAVSRDLIHWEHLPIALYPDSLGYIFSGCAVVDHGNTSGLGSTASPAVVAIFTYHNIDGERAGRNDFQSQGIAYSIDKGRTWTKYQFNPVLPNPGESRDFRDPKIVWDEPHKQWVMTLAVKDHVEFYVSQNLTQWKRSGEFGRNDGGHGGVWECPDLFAMKDADGRQKYVLLVSINPGAPNGGSGTQYFTGNFDGHTFTNDTPGKNAGWVDYGTDNYAGITYSNLPDQDKRIISLGWMSNWLYAQTVPTTKWRNAMTIPRELTLVNVDDRLVLASNPVSEIQSLRSDVVVFDNLLLTHDTTSKAIILPAREVEIDLEFEREDSLRDFVIELSNVNGETLLVGLDSKLNQFYIDRTNSGQQDFNSAFARRHFGPRRSSGKDARVKLLIDAASIELFADGGTLVMTDLIFPTSEFLNLKVIAAGKGVKTKFAQAVALKSIWRSHME